MPRPNHGGRVTPLADIRRKMSYRSNSAAERATLLLRRHHRRRRRRPPPLSDIRPDHHPIIAKCSSSDINHVLKRDGRARWLSARVCRA